MISATIVLLILAVLMKVAARRIMGEGGWTCDCGRHLEKTVQHRAPCGMLCTGAIGLIRGDASKLDNYRRYLDGVSLVHREPTLHSESDQDDVFEPGECPLGCFLLPQEAEEELS